MLYSKVKISKYKCNAVILVPARRASGVCLQNWPHPSHPELCLFPADSALRDAKRNTACEEERDIQLAEREVCFYSLKRGNVL